MAPTPAHFHLELRSLLKNFAGILGAQSLAALLQLGTVALIANVWGPAGNGAYVVALLLPTVLASFLNLGLNSANVYFLGASRFPRPVVVLTSAAMLLLLSVTGLAAGGLLVWLRGDQIFPGIGQSILWLALAGFPLGLALTFMVSLFQGMQRFRQLNLIMLAQPALMLAVAGGLFAFDVRDVAWVVGGNLFSLLVAVGLAWTLYRRHVKAEGSSSRFNPTLSECRSYLKQAFSYGNKAWLSNLLTLLQARSDVFLVNMLLNPVAAGTYAIAFQLAEKLWMLSHAISMVILPRLSELDGNESRRVQITTVTSRLVLAVSGLGALAAALCVWPLIGIVFGPEYDASYFPFLLLLPGVVALASARVIANDIAARGRPELNLYMAAFGVVFSVAGNLVVLPRFGIAGAAVVTSGAYIVDLVLKILVYRSITEAPFLSLIVLRTSDLREVRGALRGGQPRPA